ncbi:MAG: putative peptidoglycan lipid flippase [Acidobacteriota bacterium]|jgi:putative peptidoglycan lipid II flippase|nr:putative peptidoglycan lipid flippase [Acidobacteriota bacterium]
MTEPLPPETPPPPPRSGGAAAVALGILSSRLIGFVRERAYAHFLGVGPHMDVLRVAFRAPNVIQNLLGEGTLSAAFIPIYSRMLEEGRKEEAGRFAGAVFGLLLAAASAFSLLGVLFARPLVAFLAAGFVRDTGPVDRFELAVTAARIVFPMTGFLVLSAWALGVLNSHRKFFLPYFAPIVWNAAIIAAMVWAGSGHGLEQSNRLLFAVCWGGLLGGLLQFLVQLPAVAREIRGFRLSFSTRVPGVREALSAFAPVLAGRGVVQLSGYLDVFLASWLIVGAPSILPYAQTPYMLPVSLFGMSVAAAELPELSRLGRGGGTDALLARVRGSLRKMAFLNVPTCIGYLAFGYLIIGLLLRTGKFQETNNWIVYLALCGYTIGLVATTSSRLLQNTFYALGEARTPARIAVWRVALSTVIAVPLMFLLDRVAVTDLVRAEGEPFHLGAVGLALGSGVASWLELLLLRRAAARSAPGALVPWRDLGRMTLLALAAAVPAALVWWALPPLHVALQALAVVGVYALGYLLLARVTGAEELGFWLGRFGRRLRT